MTSRAEIGRRRFLRGLLGCYGVAKASAQDSLPSPENSGIEHVVVVTMENRSFDHLLGWHPNADGLQPDAIYLDSTGGAQQPWPLAPDYSGCAHPDPDHSYDGARVQLNGGAMDGFLRSGSNDAFSIGYYAEPDRPFFSALARNYTTLDRYFCSFLGPTFPNRMFLHAAQTDRLDDSIAAARVDTIWDRLADAGVSGRYYYSNVPFLAIWNLRYFSITHSYSQFLADAAAGHLPAVSFIDPRFTVEPGSDGNDDHPHSDIRAGDGFLAQTFQALANSPAWASTVMIVTYDEWGGFFDHVAPPRAVAANRIDTDAVDGKTLLGFRVPTLIVSPFSRGDAADPLVLSQTFEHTSILKLIEWRWNLPPLTPRDAAAETANLALALDFENPSADVPLLPLGGPTSFPSCPTVTDAAAPHNWLRLMRSPRLDGWR